MVTDLASHASGSAASDLITFLENYWWLILIFGGGIIDWFLETMDAGLGALAQASRRRYKRKLRLRTLELQIAQAKATGTSVAPLPGPCVHRRVKQVRDRDDYLVAWLCQGCDEQLPADWAVAAEDVAQ